MFNLRDDNMKKKIIFVLLIMLTIFLSGCENNGGGFKDDSYPYPSKRKPKEVLLEYQYIEGEELNFVEEFILTSDKSIIESEFKNGTIYTYEEFISYGIDLDLEESYFEDKFLVGKISTHNTNASKKKFIKAIHQNDSSRKTILIYTEYPGGIGIVNRDKTTIYLYSFFKEEINFKEYSCFFSDVKETYIDPSTYLNVYFNYDGKTNFKNFYESILKEYQLNSHFYIDKVGEKSIKLRISNQEVDQELFEKIFSSFVKDKRVSYYYVERESSNPYGKENNDLFGEINRDGFFGFNKNYDYLKSYQDNVIIVRSKDEYNDLVSDYFAYLEEIGEFDYVYFNSKELKELFIESIQAKYSEEFFLENDLVLFGITEGSGSIRHIINNVTEKKGNITIEITRIIPYIGTDDMAYYTVYIPVLKHSDKIIIDVNNVGLGES